MKKYSPEEKLSGYFGCALVGFIGYLVCAALYDFIIWISNHFLDFLIYLSLGTVYLIFIFLCETGWESVVKMPWRRDVFKRTGRKAFFARIAVYLLILAVVSLFVGFLVLCG